MPLISLEIKDSKSPKRNSMAKVKIIPVIALSSHLNDSTSHADFLYSVASIDAEGRTINDGN